MEGFTKPRIGVLLICLLLSSLSAADILPGLPGKNVNIIGPTAANPALANPTQERETVLRQQNEPSCTVRPENPAYIFCAFNDYRATDFPLVQGDSWMGVSWTADFGKTWYSRLAPGYKAHPNSLGFDFAADPNVVSAPGNSPGIVVLNYLAASRDLDDGVMAIQRWAVMPEEDVNYYAPENRIIEVDRTNSGRFADKPTLIAVVDPENKQSTQTIVMTLEDGSTVTRNVPSATLVLCYSIFTGSNSSKIICKTSGDWGETWSKDNKISEEQTRVQGVSLTNIGNRIVASWRRADKNKGDAIVTAVSTNGAKSWTKGLNATDLCPIDQLATSAQIRMLDFPWSANDGERFYLFAADRRFAGTGTTAENCATGIPKIGVTWSDDGITWSPLQVLDDPANISIEPTGNGYQYIPTAAGYRGNVQVAWYDTRRETYAFPGGQLPNELGGSREPVEMRDYITATGSILSRKADVYTVKIRGVDDAGQKLAIPEISQSIRVSQYRTLLSNPLTGAFLETPVETEGHFPNAKIFVDGTRAFNGDYTAAAVADFRKNIDGSKWIQNSKSTLSAAMDRENVFVAWGDTRDLRGQYLPSFDNNPSPFTPNNVAAGLIAQQQQDRIGEEGTAEPAEIDTASQPAAASGMLAESEPDVPATFGLCQPGEVVGGEYVFATDRTRDANVYGSMIRHVSSFVALTRTKPLGGLQRTYPIVITNPDELIERKFRLQISGQPGDFSSNKGRASWKQLPNKLFDNQDPLQAPVTEIDVVVDAKSAAARTLFLITEFDPNVSIPVDMYELFCPAGESDCTSPEPVFIKRIEIGGGDLLNSEFCQNNPDSEGCADVLSTETHNPLLLTNPDLISPDLLSPDLLSPDLLSPDLLSPDLLSPDLLSLGFASPDLLSPDLLSPDLISPDLLSPDLLSPDLLSPDLLSPDLLSPDLLSYSYQDLTYTVQNSGNVTTTYSADMSFNGIDDPNMEAQIIVWTAYVTATSRDCNYGPFGEHQVLAAKTLTDAELAGLDLPTVDDPFAGPVSFAARSGQVINVTLRVFAPTAALNGLSNADFAAATGFGASAHSCNDPDNIDPAVDCLTVDNEKIIIDAVGPVFDGLQSGDVIPAIPPGPPFEADGVGGSCVDLLGGLDPLISASDDSPVAISCLLVSSGATICGPGEEGLSIPLMSDPTDGSTAALVDCTATDTADNSTTIRLGIAVADTTAPEFTSVPFNPTTVEADPLTGTAILNLEAGFTAADTADDSPIISCVADTSDVSGNSVGPGIYSITCNASDLSNNVSPDHVYSLQVLDVTDPTFDIVPASFTAEADNSSGATVTFTVTAEDTAGAAIVSCSPLSDTVFPFGPTTVNCTASDSATPPNTATTSFVVTVSDSIAPTFDIVPGSFTAEADSAAGALVSYTKPTASDSAGNATVDCSPAPGTVFGFGATTVTCTATDSATPTPNTAMTSFVVTVSDTTAPTFSSVPGNITAEATSSAGAAVPYSVTATDNGGDPAVSCIPTSGSVFVIGTTLVSCTATDGAMPTPNTTTASFNVTINDSTAPTFDVVPASFTVEADSSAGAFVTYTAPTASDTAGNASVVCSPNSDTVFGFGATTVTCIATDGATPANTATTSFVVTVNDTIAPTFGTVPANFTVEADGTGGATVSYSTPTASDTAGTAIVNCTPGPGTVFGFGITTVTCTASDGASPANTVTATFDVTVADTLAPIVTLLGDPSISLQAGTAYVEPGYSASDIVSGSVLVTVSGAVDSNTPGAYTITYSAVDAAGLIGSASRTVTVIDTMAPIFDPLPVIAPVEATGPGGSIVIYNVTATDLSSGGASVSCAPTSGSTFAIGTTAVNCTATDTSSPPNTATASFSITVADSTAPAFNFVPGDISVTTFTLDADVEYSAASLGLTSTDIVDGPRPAVCTRDDDPASTSVNFGYGTWGITCTASDSASPINTATTAFDIIVSFGFGIELQLPKGNIRAGSTLPLDWQYLNLANPNIVEESGFIVPAIKWEGPFASRDCAGVPGSVDGEDSGSSGFRYSASKKTWQYSWQTPIESGGYVVTVSPPGNPLGTPASACVFLR